MSEKNILPYEEEFLSHLQFNLCYSENTVAAYKRDLGTYKKFTEKKKRIQELYQFLSEKGLSSRSQVRVVSCLRTYFKFLQSKGEKIKDIKYLKFPKTEKKLPQWITLKEFESLWTICEEKNNLLTLRNKLILSFLYGLGCRASELISLNVQDFNKDESWIRVTGKGNRQRLIPLSAELYYSLMEYLTKVRSTFVTANKSHLFFNNRGNRLSRVDLWRWLRDWSFKAGFKTVKNPHSFRHGCATALLEKGADLKSIQKLLGHLNIQTTQIYTSVVSDQIKKTIEKYHPLSEEQDESSSM